jgi:amino acid adenylation domain-containing protein
LSIFSLTVFMSYHSSKLTDTNTTLVDLLRDRAMNQPEQVGFTFLVDGENVGGYLSYGELDQCSRIIASELTRLGVKGERALLLYPPGLEFVAAFFGCLYAGVIAVPLYPPQGSRYLGRIQAIAADAMAAVALTTQLVFKEIEGRSLQIPELKALRWVLTDELQNDKALEWQPPKIREDALAYLQYTSGSTSTPKGVMISHENVLHNSKCIQQAFELTPDSLSVSWLPHFHDMGLIDGIIQPLYTGFPGVLMPPISFLQQPMRWLQAISRYRATHCGAPNFAYELCVEKITPEQRSILDLRCWQSAYNGAEQVRKVTLERFIKAFELSGFKARFFYPCYGLAEATLMVSGGLVNNEPVYCHVQADALEKNQIVEVTHPGEKVIALVGCGRSWNNTLIMIANPESLTICPPNEVGEIWVSSLSVAQGYWNRPDQTQKTYQAYLTDTGNGPFLRTGDLGFLRDGELFVTGRIKELVIIRGRNHYPQDIELTAQKSHSALRAGCGAAFAVSKEGVERLVIVQEVERTCLRKVDVEAVAKAIRSAVAQEHELMVYAVVLLRTGKLPKTSSGKIQRQIALESFLARTLDEVGRSVIENWDEFSDKVALTREELLAIEPFERQQRLVNYLHSSVCLVLKVPTSQINLQQPLSQLGLDSLMVIELKHKLETDLGVVVSVVDFLQRKSLTQLAQQVLQELNNCSAHVSTPVISASEQLSEYPLSHNQHALWLVHQLAPDSAAYNIFFAFKILSNLELVALQQVFQLLSQRHRALRTTFSTNNAQPVQRVHEQLGIAFEETDASSWTEDELNQRLVEAAHFMFDLEHGPLMRVGLFRRGAKEDILLFTIHHIISDFWSLEILVDEIRVLYDSVKKDTVNTLPPINWQYADYIVWQQNMLASPQGERLWDYWYKQLAGELPVLNLPTDKPRPPVQTYRGTTHTVKLDIELAQRLKAVAHAEEATLYMVLLATFFVLLYRYTGVEDILVGTPAAARSRAEFASVVGYFVTTVVVRSNLSGNPTFKEFLAQVRQTVLGALEHQDYPFPLLVERLHPQRDPSYSPLFQVMFTFFQPSDLPELSALVIGEAGTQIDLGELQLESVALETRIAQFDLTLMIVESDDRLTARWQYNTDLFEPATISRMADHFLTLVQGIVTNVEQHLGELPLLTPTEQQQLLVEWNHTQLDYPQNKCIHQLFESQVEQTPTAVAAVFDNTQLTYHQLNCRANQLAHYLQQLGVKPDVLVGIYLERSLEMIVALLATLKAGGAYVPLDTRLPNERLAFILSDIQVSIVLTQKQLLEKLPTCGIRIVSLDTDKQIIHQQSSENPNNNIYSHNLGYVLYTSGSTGKPKGVAIEHRSTVSFLTWAKQVYNSEQLAGVLASTSICFDLSVFELFAPLSWGGKVILVENALHLPTLKNAKDVTLINTVPSVCAELLRIGNIPDSVHTVNLAGEPLSNQLVKQIYQQQTIKQVFNLYGPTEATTYSIFSLIDRHTNSPPPIGLPIANTQIYILDSHLQPVPIGVVGELYITGVGLARGYLNRSELTTEKFIPNPFQRSRGAGEQGSRGAGEITPSLPHSLTPFFNRLYKTGDLARYLTDGNIEYIGRSDYQAKIRGFRIELAEIEAILVQYPMVRETVVIVREDNPGDKRLIAYVVPKQSPLVEDELRSFLKEKLPQYMLPSAFVILDCLPLTPNGKIDRRALPIPQALTLQLPGTYALPQTQTEQQVASVWQEVLQLEQIGIDNNFFDLGGNSFLMVRVHSRLKEIFKKDILMVDMFKYPTVRDLTKYLSQEEVASKKQEVASKKQEGIKESAIAIIGMSCRFPGAQNIEEFWHNLRKGVESISFFSDSELLTAGVEPELLSHPNYVKASAVLPDIERFDASFFGINPQEAKTMDPQHRFFLEVSWEALENAGYNPKTFAGAIGVYAGAGMNTYLLNNLYPNRDIKDSVGEYQLMINNDKDFLPTRISYKLNLSGPSVSVQTACSTSLVAIHLACQSLKNGECDMAIAGGVSIRVPQQVGYLYHSGMILSPDGQCRAFDAQSQGTVPGNGVGIVVLKRLEDAIADGDYIHAIIKGSAINNDGALKVGYTAPSIDGQAAVIADAQAIAGIDPQTITYIEAHGTGTALGDPIEIAALTQAFENSTRERGFCAIGSVKTNIGHLDTAAGIAGLLKTVLALKHKQLPPSLHFVQPNSKIDFTNSPFYVNTKLSQWNRKGTPLRAGVSSFGIGGTNAHIILEEAGEAGEAGGAGGAGEETASISSLACERLQHIFTLSAKSEDALQQLAQRYLNFLASQEKISISDICFTVNTGRAHFDYRLAIVVESTIKLREQLEDFATTRKTTTLSYRKLNSQKPPMIVFLFTGEAVHDKGIVKELYETQPTFRATVDRCDEIWRAYLEANVETLHGDVETLHATSLNYLNLFSIQYALFVLWRCWGVTPNLVLGDSVGEYVAACIAGVFSLEDALPLMMEQVLSQEDNIAQQITYYEPKISIISNDTGKLAASEIATVEYWCRHQQKPVRVAESIENLSQQGYEVFVEIAPNSTLLEMGSQRLPAGVRVWLPSLRQGYSATESMLQSLATLYLHGVEIDWLGMNSEYQRRRVALPTYPFERQHYWIDPPAKGYQTPVSGAQKHDVTPIVNLLNQGNTEELTQLLEQEGNFSLEQKKLLPELMSVLVKQHQKFKAARASIKDLFYDLEWQPKPRQLKNTTQEILPLKPGSWLILADQNGVGQTLAKLLEEFGQKCLLIFQGNTYSHDKHTTWIINPSNPSDFSLVLREALENLEFPLHRVVHLWSLDATQSETELLSISDLGKAQLLGCSSVLHLIQTLIHHNNHNVETLHATSPQNEASDPQLWLVTRGAMPVKSDTVSIAVAQAPLWGLGKVIALEHPQLWGGMIDLAPGDCLNEAAANLLDEICDSLGEDHLAFREGQRYVARLKPTQLSESQKMRLKTDNTYLITGGLGALGLKVARWMVEQGAKHLVLTGRHQASIEQQEILSQLHLAGAKILVAQADVSRQEDMRKVLEEMKVTMPPLRGIIHAAGVLDDGTLQSQKWERFTRVMSPKVEGAWNLHTLTQNEPLDFFILFSSAASLLGSSSQGNYAAANAFMDALAHHRQRLGLPGLSINWGQWAETGMATSLSSHYQRQLTAMGISPITPSQGLQVLEVVLGSTKAQVGVLSVEWSVFRQKFSSGQQLPLFSDLVDITPLQEVQKHTQIQHQKLKEKLQEVHLNERQDILIAHIQEEVAQVLGLEPSQWLHIEQGFSDMGMDSLLALKLKNRLETSLGSSLPETLTFEYPTIKKLAEYIAIKILKWESIAPKGEKLSKLENKQLEIISEIEQLSEEEIQTSIEKELTVLETFLKDANS